MARSVNGHLIHVHVIPEGNEKLRGSVPSPDLSGDDMSGAWRSVLREPESYVVVTPGDLLSAAAGEEDAGAFLCYLDRRYGLEDQT